MEARKLVIAIGLSLLVAGAAPVLAEASQEERHLDADTDGVARETSTNDTFEAEVNVTGDVIITESEEGVDRTAFTDGLTATANVTIDGTTYEIPVGVVGEGVSLVQTGVSADAWRLHVEGTQTADEDTRDQPTLAQFSGNLTLTGGQDGEYVAEGEGILTVFEGEDATTYDLAYTGSATFE